MYGYRYKYLQLRDHKERSMSELTPQELTAQGNVMVTFLHRQLAEAIGRIAALEGEKAVLEIRLAKATTPEAKPDGAE